MDAAAEKYLAHIDFLAKRLTPRDIRALDVLIHTEIAGDWIKPGQLYPKACGYNKTTETWKELHRRGFVRMRRKEVNDNGRTVRPTKIRIRTDEEGLRLLAYHAWTDHRVRKILVPSKDNRTIYPFWERYGEEIHEIIRTSQKERRERQEKMEKEWKEVFENDRKPAKKI